LCYTIEINLTREQLVKRFNAAIDPGTPFRKGQRINAFSLPQCPIICAENPANIQLFTWGLIPSWCRDMEYAREIRLKTFNAKSETLSEKKSFRHLVKDRKCLVLTNGFYEWQARGKDKQPYFISVKDTEGIALAGLHDSWTNKETGEMFNTFTIITTEANPMMAKIHNTKKRMPVILSEQDELAWIDPALSPDQSFSYLKPFDERLMIAEEVDKALFTRRKADEWQQTIF
jgi:putative SOS response-associated peptidase YedK